MKSASILIILTVFSFYGCSSQKNLSITPPFKVNNPICQQYAGGREESGRGFVLELPVSVEGNDEVVFLEVYFRGHKLETGTKGEGENLMIVCNYKDTSRHDKPDIIMHSDPKKEVGNQLPGSISEKNTDFPFDLKKDEAVLSYKITSDGDQESKVMYFKISGIKDKPIRAYQ